MNFILSLSRNVSIVRVLHKALFPAVHIVMHPSHLI